MRQSGVNDRDSRHIRTVAHGASNKFAVNIWRHLDSAASHKRFIEKKQLPFRLIADENHTIHEQYGTWVQKSMFGKQYWGTARLTFVIDEAGKVIKVIDRVTTASHAAQIL